MTCRHYRLLRLHIFLVFVDDLFFGDGLDGLFYLQKRMFMVDLLLTVAAEVEAIAKNALITDTQNAKVIFAFRAYHVMHQQLIFAGRLFLKLYKTKDLSSGR